MNILVTGGFGFIGGHLIDLLTRCYPQARVHIVDNLLSNPVPVDVLMKDLGPRAGLTYQICSVGDFCRSNDSTSWDQIYHLASIVGPAGVLKHAGRMIKSIVDDTYDIIDLSQRHKAKLLLVSTSEVYGADGLCSESSPRIIPAITTVRSEYAVGKMAAEMAVLNTIKVTSLEAVVVRPFNIAGPRQSAVGGFVLPRFIAQAIRGKPLTVFGSGKQLRAFTHVADAAQGLLAAMQYGVNGKCYNLGNEANRTTIEELADNVIRLTGAQSKKQFVDPKAVYGPLYEEAADKYPDATATMQELNWYPQLSVEAVVKDTFKYMLGLDDGLLSTLSGLVPLECRNV
ncbi:MAG: NAD-dependent epimerase/dehydratase family protein [Oligoflexia bacterium]|nr:NAD-dependent epimerase/dehydratase family protein [Oligoflexia bacterium]